MNSNLNFLARIKQLKYKAPLYPKIYTNQEDDVFYITSIVEFENNGIKYKRHHVQSGILNENTTISDIINCFTEEVQKTIKFGVYVPDFDDIN